MAKQKRIGFFFELPVEEQRNAISSLRNDEAHAREDEIIQYLNSGVDAGVAMLVEQDYLQEPPAILGGTMLKSDGEWVWPVSLAYFVREYHISLPQEFIDRMESRNWHVPPDVQYSPDVPEGHVEM